MNGWLRHTFMLTFIALLGLSWGIPVLKADEKQTAKSEESEDAAPLEGDILTIDSSGYRRDRKGPVVFSHKKHAMNYKISCWQCHHEYVNDKNVWLPWGETKECQECHDPLKAQGKVLSLQKAYHINCKGCHQVMAQTGEKSGPYKKCSGCHEKVK